MTICLYDCFTVTGRPLEANSEKLEKAQHALFYQFYYWCLLISRLNDFFIVSLRDSL